MLMFEEHLRFIKALDERVKKLDYWQADYLRMNGIYWALTALLLLRGDLQEGGGEEEGFDECSPLRRQEILDYIVSCQCPRGGFGGNIGHDAHLTFTLSAIQILVMMRAVNDPRINLERHVKCNMLTLDADPHGICRDYGKTIP